MENLFSIIRAKGAQRDNPDAGQFRTAFRQVMVDSVMAKSNVSNCEADVDTFICSLENVKKSQSTAISIVTNSEDESVMSSIPWSVKSILYVCTLPQEEEDGLDNQENNILAYIGGYIVRKIRGKICTSCCDKIVSKVDSEKSKSPVHCNKSYNSLLAPSKLLLGTIQLMEIRYRKHIKTCIHQEHLKIALAVELSKIENLNQLHCQSCHLHLLVLHLLINIRLHHTIKEINQGLKDNKDRKNRKTIKFSHL